MKLNFNSPTFGDSWFVCPILTSMLFGISEPRIELWTAYWELWEWTLQRFSASSGHLDCLQKHNFGTRLGSTYGDCLKGSAGCWWFKHWIWGCQDCLLSWTLGTRDNWQKTTPHGILLRHTRPRPFIWFDEICNRNLRYYCVLPKNRGVSPKMDGENNGKPY